MRPYSPLVIQECTRLKLHHGAMIEMGRQRDYPIYLERPDLFQQVFELAGFVQREQQHADAAPDWLERVLRLPDGL